MYACTSVCVNFVFVCKNVCEFTAIYLRQFVFMQVCVWLCVQVCVWLCIQVCVCGFICKCVNLTSLAVPTWRQVCVMDQLEASNTITLPPLTDTHS